MAPGVHLPADAEAAITTQHGNNTTFTAMREAHGLGVREPVDELGLEAREVPEPTKVIQSTVINSGRARPA